MSWKFLISFVAPVSSQVLFLAPLADVHLLRDGEIHETDLLPLLSILVNGLLYVVYGLLTADASITICNVPGAALGLYYINIYRNHSRRGLRGNALVVALSAFLLMYIFISAIACSLEDARVRIGMLGAVLSVVLMASPLANLRVVIRDQNSKTLSLRLSVFAFLTGFLWTLKGSVFDPDPMIWVPNFIGTAAAFLQLLLFCKYRNGKPVKKDDDEPKAKAEAEV